jgi:hypothetical protein
MKLWKVQKFFGDVVYDLRQRGLLPVVVLLLVGMVAVPLLIAGGGSKSSPTASESVIEQAAELAPENQKAVVAYQPGVRNYKDRLKDLTAKDPFKQQFTQAATAASQLETSLTGGGGGATSTQTDTGTTSEVGGETGSTTTPDTGGSTDTGGGGGGGGGNGGKSKVRYFYYTTDLLVGEAALTLQRRNGVKALTPLPSEYAPVAIYLGATLDGKRALFLISNEVTQVSGQGQCLPSPTDCSMLALRRDQTEDLLYGVDGKIYRITVIQNRRIISSKPPQG